MNAEYARLRAAAARDRLVIEVAQLIYDELEGPVANQDATRQMRQWEQSQRIAHAILTHLTPKRIGDV